MNPTERKIVRKLIETIHAEGLTISVNDGEETTLRRSTDPDVVMDHLCTTEYDWLYVYDAAGHRLGAYMLVWGNDRDVISDFAGATAEMDRLDHLCKPALKLANDL